MVVMAQMTTACFDTVFGPHLMSLPCLGASMAYSLADYCLMNVMLWFPLADTIVQVRGPALPALGATPVVARAIWAAIFFVLGNLRVLAPLLVRAQFWPTTVAFTLFILMDRHNLHLFGGAHLAPISTSSLVPIRVLSIS